MTKAKLGRLAAGMIVGLGIMVVPAFAQLSPRFKICHAASMAVMEEDGRKAADEFFDFCMGL